VDVVVVVRPDADAARKIPRLLLAGLDHQQGQMTSPPAAAGSLQTAAAGTEAAEEGQWEERPFGWDRKGVFVTC
jgi:hypothetical protein